MIVYGLVVNAHSNKNHVKSTRLKHSATVSSKQSRQATQSFTISAHGPHSLVERKLFKQSSSFHVEIELIRLHVKLTINAIGMLQDLTILKMEIHIANNRNLLSVQISQMNKIALLYQYVHLEVANASTKPKRSALNLMN